jgi:hypothetical protein
MRIEYDGMKCNSRVSNDRVSVVYIPHTSLNCMGFSGVMSSVPVSIYIHIHIHNHIHNHIYNHISYIPR